MIPALCHFTLLLAISSSYHTYPNLREHLYLRIKHFVGNSENAVMIQLYTALTVYLLLAYQKFLSRIGLSVQQILEILQLNLFGTVSLEELLHQRQREKQNPYYFSLLNCVA